MVSEDQDQISYLNTRFKEQIVVLYRQLDTQWMNIVDDVMLLMQNRYTPPQAYAGICMHYPTRKKTSTTVQQYYN